ncbi:hypothetical protein K1T71_001504 [Dendrolimus kikuchii]|uniref:Uncharacterized protein n=1 Tax=Dendrolimus kikuchii TaxID=765133 RepID=A0ACC1DHT1_9NEOP|nr:hypothetical protein K1T71_001504 [Dendrolimus kikuchii]
MSKLNPLAGLIGNYGDSDEESDDGIPSAGGVMRPGEFQTRASLMVGHAPPLPEQPPGIHPAPIAHCPWSACYDESSGFTYYWNQQTNAVTWDAPPEYLLALRLAQQQLHSAGSTEVSAEEWQLYQQALAEKQNAQNKVIAKTPVVSKPPKKAEKAATTNKTKTNKLKRSLSDDEVEKIELITSYHNSDSESEPETPVKTQPPPKVVEKPKNPHKKPKIKPQPVLEYGPTLPPNQNYTAPIGPEMPPELLSSVPEGPQKLENHIKEEDKKSIKTENEDSQDENELLIKLKSKAKILENLGGEIPTELQKIIEDETKSLSSPKSVEISNNIDDLLDEIEKKELPKVVKHKKIDIFDDGTSKETVDSPKNSPKSCDGTPPVEATPLFPSIKNINETETIAITKPKVEETVENDVSEKKTTNVYLSETKELENVSRKKLRISNSVLPEKKKTETPAYTTKYAEFIEGFSSERTGLGFTKEDEVLSPKNTISYGNGLMFTKGETLNEEKKEDDLEDLTELVELKLKYLNQLQPCIITPVQEMLIQMQTLLSAFRAGALSPMYWRKWTGSAADALLRHETLAAPPGWTCSFQRSEGRYRYSRDCDGLTQWEYPATANMDMDISTTPPHPGIDGDATPPPPPLPLSPPPPPPPPVVWPQAHTPPPPVWDDPPPPGCDDVPPLPTNDPKQGIGDELASFYSDLAEIEKQTSAPHTASNSPEPPPPPAASEAREKPKEKDREKEREKDKDRVKKKAKVKISTSIGLKHKSVSNLVAKWQQVAEEINSD